MPTTNPRVNVTLSPSLDGLLSKMAGLARTSKSALLRELLEAAEPSLIRAVALMDAASKARAGAKAELVRGLDRAQADAEAVLDRSLNLVERHYSRDLVGDAEAIRGRRPRVARPAAPERSAVKNPPPSNRGVKSPSRGARVTVPRVKK